MKDKIEIDQKKVDEKAYKIGEIIDGMTMPEVFSILGTVIIEVVVSACNQGIDIRRIACGWLRMLCKNIMGVNVNVSERKNVLAN